MVLVVFKTFFIWNGSIVLGAKEAHVVSPQLVRMVYFILVSAAALAPLHFSLGQAATLCQSFWRNKIRGSFQVLMALIIGFIVVHLFSIAHPYLLADNRQYPFYIWRKVIHAHWTMKYLLVPLYVYSWISIITILGTAQKKIWVVLFILATALVLISTPFFFLVLNSPIKRQYEIERQYEMLFIGALNLSVDIFTMMMFLFRPFRWDHEPGTQVYMVVQ